MWWPRPSRIWPFLLVYVASHAKSCGFYTLKFSGIFNLAFAAKALWPHLLAHILNTLTVQSPYGILSFSPNTPYSFVLPCLLYVFCLNSFISSSPGELTHFSQDHSSNATSFQKPFLIHLLVWVTQVKCILYCGAVITCPNALHDTENSCPTNPSLLINCDTTVTEKWLSNQGWHFPASLESWVAMDWLAPANRMWEEVSHTTFGAEAFKKQTHLLCALSPSSGLRQMMTRPSGRWSQKMEGPGLQTGTPALDN